MKRNIEILLAVGCNHDREQQMSRARERLTEAFPGIVFTDAITTPAYGMEEDALPYSNLLAKATTAMTVEELKGTLKRMEKELGDTAELRRKSIVMMDIDLLEYGKERHHCDDWNRPYIKQLLSLLRSITRTLSNTIVTLILLLAVCLSANAQGTSQSSKPTASTTDRKQDAELLGKAVEYYQGGKYHECILAFEKLQKNYTLNPRFKAYLGFCYYKESQYEDAVECLQQGIPELTAFSPKEQAVYIYSCAESLFHQEKYRESIDYYEKALPLTEGNDRGDVLFHTAFAHHLLSEDTTAIPLFTEALQLYRKHTIGTDELHVARRKQTEIMLRGLAKLYPKETEEEAAQTDNME